MKLQRNVSPLLVVLTLAALPIVAHADDGGDGGGDYNFPASNVVNVRPMHAGSLTCAEATRAAWFNRQVEISDGDVSPSIPMPAECDRKVLAKADTNDETK
jgi:hypothetical protein